MEFLAEFTQHIPPKGARLIRDYGWYFNKAHGLRRKAAAEHGNRIRRLLKRRYVSSNSGCLTRVGSDTTLSRAVQYVLFVSKTRGA
jgi:hypothetical protein